MGKIKHIFVKRSSKRFYELEPDKFSSDFNNNKKVLTEKKLIESKSTKNKMAGYLVRLVKNKKF